MAQPMVHQFIGIRVTSGDPDLIIAELAIRSFPKLQFAYDPYQCRQCRNVNANEKFDANLIA